MDSVDLTFFALSDGTRRAVIGLLRKGPLRASEIADSLGMSRPAMSRHLRVLRDAGLVREALVQGDHRGRTYTLEQAPFTALRGWLDEVETLWTEQLASFKDHVERRAVEHQAAQSKAGRKTKP